MSASDTHGEIGHRGRISLRKIDSLLLGELPEAEAATLRAAIENDPAARAYLERQAGLQSGLSEASLRAELRKMGAGRSRAALLPGWRAYLRRIGEGLSGSRGQAAAVLGAMACLAAGLTLWTGGMPGKVTQESYRSKGSSAMEVAIRHKGHEYEPGDLIPARSGDTLVLAYRGGDSLRAQIWIREDDGEPVPVQGSDFPLPPVTAWSELPQRILLEGAWSRQQLWILLSPRTLDRDASEEAVRGGRVPEGARLLTYRLSAST